MRKLAKRSIAVALLAASLPALQGCFPVVATGVGAGALMIADRRTSGAYIDDQGIEIRGKNRIGEEFGSNTHVDVTAFNRQVLLTGNAKDEAAKAQIEKIITGVPNVRGIVNELQIGPAASFGTRSNDAYITSKVKANFVDANKFYANHVKVTTENGVVYLMGLVTRREADDATQIASTTRGVQKVVRVFEYIADDQAKQLDTRPPESTAPAGGK